MLGVMGRCLFKASVSVTTTSTAVRVIAMGFDLGPGTSESVRRGSAVLFLYRVPVHILLTVNNSRRLPSVSR